MRKTEAREIERERGRERERETGKGAPSGASDKSHAGGSTKVTRLAGFAAPQSDELDTAAMSEQLTGGMAAGPHRTFSGRPSRRRHP